MRKRKAERIRAILVVFAVEMAVTTIVTLLFAAVIIPIAYAERGYYAAGGEFILLLAVALGTYRLIHRYFCSLAETKGGKKRGGNGTAC